MPALCEIQDGRHHLILGFLQLSWVGYYYNMLRDFQFIKMIVKCVSHDITSKAQQVEFV